MDFSGGAGGGGGGGAKAGEDLRDIETEQLGFQAASGDDKVRLLPSPWPSDALPPPTSSLLSVASSKGLVAAAGPDGIVIARTDSIRNTFASGAGENKVKSFTAQTSLQTPRVSHVAFSSDESCLVVAAEQGGGLAVYSTDALLNGNTSAAFELGTEGKSVRQVLPNPNPAADLAGFFGIVTSNGKLLLADLKEKKLVPASSGGNVFHEQVSCACWSKLGKQIIAGLADGTAVQIDRQGAVKAQIPEPPQLAGLKDPSSTATPITSIFWLETDDFLIIHTPLNQPNAGASDDSIYHLAHRDKQTKSWNFNKFTDPCFPFLDRRPANHFIQRLRDWGSLTELLIVSSTASSDIGMYTRSKVALNPADPVEDAFTETKAPDSRRAALPMTVAGDADTSPIGMALDLSAKEKIARPIPTDETLDESPVPLPALYILNHEGMLSMWWIVYNEAVRQNIIYPDLVAAGGPRGLDVQKQSTAQPQQTSSTMAPFGSTTPGQTPAFGQSSFGAAKPSSTPAQAPAFGKSTFGTPNTSATPQQPLFGQSTFGAPSTSSSTPSQKPAFGAPSTPAFGGTSTMGNRQSPWGAPSSVATGGGSAFGKPTFGQPSAFGQSSFGQVGGMGPPKTSVWGTPSASSTSQQNSSGTTGSVFGGNASQQSPFMNLGGKSGASAFASVGDGSSEAAASPFASATPKPTLSTEPSGSTISFGNNTSFGSGSNFGVQSRSSFFGSPTPSAAGGGTFGQPSAPASREESMRDDTATIETAPPAKPPTHDENKSPFGLGSGGFKLGSTFKGDGTAKDDLPKPANPGAGLFGAGFGNALNDTKAASNSDGAAWMSGGSSPVKKEPGTETVPKLSDIPAAPVKQDSPLPSDDAPLPPDPTTWKPKPGALPPPIPPGFSADFSAPKAKDPPPARDVTSPSKPGAGEDPLAGSPPVDLGKETFSDAVPSDGGAEAEGPADEGEWSGVESEGEGEDNENDEGEDDDGDEDDDGEDDEDEEEDEDEGVVDQKGLSAFEARITPASPKRAEQPQQDSTTPATERKEESYTPATEKKESFTPAGMPKAPVMFAPPQRRGPESPRSPSPQRSATSPTRSIPSFSSQPPLPAQTPKQPIPSRTPSSAQVLATSQSRTPPTQPPQRIAVPASQLGQSQQISPTSQPPDEPDEWELEDEEDARIQAVLAAPIEPTKNVPDFLAHQDYVPTGDEKAGVGGHIERVFRDINSMVDTLALNARAMQSFVLGHQPEQGEEEKDRLALEDGEPWRLGEADQLSDIINGIGTQLQDGRLTDVRSTLQDLHEDEAETTKLRSKAADVRKIIAMHKDPDQVAQQHQAPLSLETQTLQLDLRQDVQKVQALLARAEEHLSVLRAELASLPSMNANGKAASNVPTVEAVEKTIKKMTEMITQRSGDVDVLESKIRALGGPAALRSVKADYEDDLAASMRASRLSRGSPAPGRANQFRASTKAPAGRYGSPSASRREGTPGSEWKRASLLDVSEAEVNSFRAKRDARKMVLHVLRERVEERGVRVVKS